MALWTPSTPLLLIDAAVRILIMIGNATCMNGLLSLLTISIGGVFVVGNQVVLLGGGDKPTQQVDIARCKWRWREYNA